MKIGGSEARAGRVSWGGWGRGWKEKGVGWTGLIWGRVVGLEGVGWAGWKSRGSPRAENWAALGLCCREGRGESTREKG